MWNKCKKCGIFVDNNSRCGQNAAAFCMGGDFARLNYAHRRGSPCNKQNQLWECALRSSPEGDRKALWSPPQRRNPCNKKDQHREKTTSPDAGQSRPSGATMLNRLKEQFGRRVCGRAKLLAGTLRCLRPLLSAFGITGRPWNSWGVAPSPTRGAASGLRKGQTKRDEVPPLTPSRD